MREVACVWQGRCAGAGSWSQHGGQPGSVLRCGSVSQPHTIRHLMVPSPNHSTAQTGQGFAGHRVTWVSLQGLGGGLCTQDQISCHSERHISGSTEALVICPCSSFSVFIYCFFWLHLCGLLSAYPGKDEHQL